MLKRKSSEISIAALSSESFTNTIDLEMIDAAEIISHFRVIKQRCPDHRPVVKANFKMYARSSCAFLSYGQPLFLLSTLKKQVLNHLLSSKKPSEPLKSFFSGQLNFVESFRYYHDRTLLHIASMFYRSDIINIILLNARVSFIKAKDIFGNNFLHYLSFSCSMFDLSKWLVCIKHRIGLSGERLAVLSAMIFEKNHAKLSFRDLYLSQVSMARHFEQNFDQGHGVGFASCQKSTVSNFR